MSASTFHLTSTRCALFVAVLLLLWCVVPSREVQAEDRGPLYIVTENYPPYEMEEAKKGLKGFDYEVVTEVFRSLGYRPKIVFLPWKRALQEAKLGKAVGILTCAYRPERAVYLEFSAPISLFTNGIYWRRDFDGPRPKSMADLNGQKVASVVAYESLQALKDLGLNPVAAPDTTSAVRMLSVGRFDYFYASKESTDFVLKQTEPPLDLEFQPIVEKNFHFCFSKHYPEYSRILTEFNEGLATLRANGIYDKIHAKYR